MKLNLAKVLARKYQQVVLYFNSLPALSADDLCKQIGPRSSRTICRACSGSKLFDIRMVLKKSSNKAM